MEQLNLGLQKEIMPLLQMTSLVCSKQSLFLQTRTRQWVNLNKIRAVRSLINQYHHFFLPPTVFLGFLVALGLDAGELACLGLGVPAPLAVLVARRPVSGTFLPSACRVNTMVLVFVAFLIFFNALGASLMVSSIVEVRFVFLAVFFNIFLASFTVLSMVLVRLAISDLFVSNQNLFEYQTNYMQLANHCQYCNIAFIAKKLNIICHLVSKFCFQPRNLMHSSFFVSGNSSNISEIVYRKVERVRNNHLMVATSIVFSNAILYLMLAVLSLSWLTCNEILSLNWFRVPWPRRLDSF